MSTLDTILSWDRSLFIAINEGLDNPFLNAFLPFMRNEYVWIPLYVLILLFVCIKWNKKGFLWFAWLGATTGLADVVSSHLIKKTVQRPRPCHVESEIAELLLRVECGTGYSFTSSHATNHMAIAFFIFLSASPYFGKWRWLFLPWAFIIGFAQIFVGVHFPVDVTCGFLLGGLIAYLSNLGYQRMPFANSKITPQKPRA